MILINNQWLLKFIYRLDFAHMYQVYKPRRGLKRGDDSKVNGVHMYLFASLANNLH